MELSSSGIYLTFLHTEPVVDSKIYYSNYLKSYEFDRKLQQLDYLIDIILIDQQNLLLVL